MNKALVYALTATSAVVAGAGLLIAQLPGDNAGSVAFMGMASGVFAALAVWAYQIHSDDAR